MNHIDYSIYLTTIWFLIILMVNQLIIFISPQLQLKKHSLNANQNLWNFFLAVRLQGDLQMHDAPS